MQIGSTPAAQTAIHANQPPQRPPPPPQNTDSDGNNSGGTAATQNATAARALNI